MTCRQQQQQKQQHRCKSHMPDTMRLMYEKSAMLNAWLLIPRIRLPHKCTSLCLAGTKASIHDCASRFDAPPTHCRCLRSRSWCWHTAPPARPCPRPGADSDPKYHCIKEIMPSEVFIICSCAHVHGVGVQACQPGHALVQALLHLLEVQRAVARLQRRELGANLHSRHHAERSSAMSNCGLGGCTAAPR